MKSLPQSKSELNQNTKTSHPRSSVIILSWNTIEETQACLESLRKIDSKDYETVVVDNGSVDGSKEWLSQQKDIIYVDLPVNTGFTGGQIAGLTASKGEFLVLLNNDAVVPADWLDEIIAPFNDPKVAAVGGRAYEWTDEFGAFDTASPYYSYQVVDPSMGYAETMRSGDSFTSVDSISGASVAIRRSVINEIGYFDDRFFAYYEETDLFARFKRAGYKVTYSPNVHVWHKIGVSTKDKPYFYLYQMHRNRFMYAYKNFDTAYLRPFVRSYFKEGLRAALKPGLDSRARFKALIWNIHHLPKTISDRKATQKLGPTYSQLLERVGNQTVSIVIPCYNYEKFVGEAIESALTQTTKPFEIIVINDGSTDNSLGVIKKYTPSVRVIDQKNSGVIATKNLGMKEAQGRWVVFLDADDILEPNYLEACLATATEKNVKLVYTDMDLFGAEESHFKARDKFSTYDLLRGNYIHNSALIDREFLLRSGGYKEQMKHGYEDWELYLTLAEMGISAAKARDTFLHYRQHEVLGSRNALAQNKALEIRKEVQSLHSGLYRRHNWSRKRSAIMIRLRRWLNPVWIYHTANHHIVDRFYITRKLKGIFNHLRRGRAKELWPRAKRQIQNIISGKINWRKD